MGEAFTGAALWGRSRCGVFRLGPDRPPQNRVRGRGPLGGLIEIASAIMADASRSAQTSAQNVANITTPGYRRRIGFADALAASREIGFEPTAEPAVLDLTPGKLVDTGNPYDLAVSGEGFFVVRRADGTLLYTRDGQFRRDADGRLVDGRGAVLQADGGDLLLRGQRVEVLGDGVVLEDGEPVARLDVVTFVDPSRLQPAPTGGGLLASAENVQPATSPAVRQGAVETSNVTTAAEMVSVMAALRRAEAGQRLALVYDDLMGRVISSFGQT